MVVSFITDYSLKLMIECAHLSNAFTYQGIMEASYGRSGFMFLSVLQFVYPFTGKYMTYGEALTKESDPTIHGG